MGQEKYTREVRGQRLEVRKRWVDRQLLTSEL